ncbi:MAG: hypothetical protein AMXMBFR84_01420, partial [Candidatus Hydrogenedentota bacterium]
ADLRAQDRRRYCPRRLWPRFRRAWFPIRIPTKWPISCART